MVCSTAYWAVPTVDMASLDLTLVQTLIAVMDFVNNGEGFSLTSILLVVSGTHGVVRKLLGDERTITSAE